MKVLVIDNSVDIRNLFVKIMKKLGIEEFSITGRKEEAIRKLCQEKPDIVFCDIELLIREQRDDKSGCEIIRKIRSHPREVEIIAMSATPGFENMSLAAGADIFLEKPFRFSDIRDIIGTPINA